MNARAISSGPHCARPARVRGRVDIALTRVRNGLAAEAELVLTSVRNQLVELELAGWADRPVEASA
jgi:hypothetical protein